MASDPYHNFASDLRASLNSARELARRYEELCRQRKGNVRRKTERGADELGATYDRLQDSLEALENDIGDVRESVQMVETRGPAMFGVDPIELDKRKVFVQECEDELSTILSNVRRIRGDQDVERGLIRHAKGLRGDEDHDDGYDEREEDDEEATLAFEMEHQQSLMTRQDNALDLIGNTLTSLRRQAGTLGQEIGEQVEIIGALDSEVDSTQSRLTRALGKMDELVRRSDDRMGGWCVWLLIVILMIVALIAILI